MALCVYFILGASAKLASAQVPPNHEHIATPVEAISSTSEVTLNNNFIHFWNRSGRYANLRISYKSPTGKKHSYIIGKKGSLHKPNENALIHADDFFKIRICDGCTDFKIESKVVVNNLVVELFKSKPVWENQQQNTDVPATSNSYWYIDLHKKLIKNYHTRFYTLYDVDDKFEDLKVNMWTGMIDGKSVCTITDLPNY